MIAQVLYGIGIAAALAAAGVGVNFSPSYTVLFAMVFLMATTLDELCRALSTLHFERLLLGMGKLLSLLGALFMLPAAFIYAFGDDNLGLYVGISLVAPVVLHCAIHQLLYRRRGRRLGFLASLENWLLLAAGIFTVACSYTSPALLPCGLGVLLILAGKRCADLLKGNFFCRARTVAGMLLCTAFPVAPMLF